MRSRDLAHIGSGYSVVKVQVRRISRVVGIGRPKNLSAFEKKFSLQVVGIEEACFFGFSQEKIFLSNIPNLEGVKFNPDRKLFCFTSQLVGIEKGQN